MPVSNEFKKALENSRNARTRWQEAKKVKPGDGGFSVPDVPNGQYKVRVTAGGEKTQRGDVRARIHVVIALGEHRGKSWNVDCTLISSHTNEQTRNQIEEIAWGQLSKALQVLCNVDEQEFNSWELPRIFEELDLLDKEAPYCEIGVTRKTKTQVDPKTKKSVSREYFNTYFNRLLTDEEIDEIEEEDGGGDEGSGDTDNDGSEAAGDGDDGLEVDEDSEVEGDEDGSVREESGKRETKGKEDAESGNGSAACRSSDQSGSRDRRSPGAGEGGKPTARSGARTSANGAPVAKGKYVFHKPQGRRSALEFEVTSVNHRAETYSLAEYKGDLKLKDVPWNKCQKSKG